MRASTSTGRSPIRSISTTISRWRGSTIKIEVLAGRTAAATRRCSASCWPRPRPIISRWPANCSLNWTICATISTAKSTLRAARCGGSPSAAIVGTRAYQRHVVAISLVLLGIAGVARPHRCRRRHVRPGAPGAPPAARYRRGRGRRARHRRPDHLARRDRPADPVLQHHGRRAARQGADPRDLRQICRSAHRRRADRPAGADRWQGLAPRDDDPVLRHEGLHQPSAKA